MKNLYDLIKLVLHQNGAITSAKSPIHSLLIMQQLILYTKTKRCN